MLSVKLSEQVHVTRDNGDRHSPLHVKVRHSIASKDYGVNLYIQRFSGK